MCNKLLDQFSVKKLLKFVVVVVVVLFVLFRETQKEREEWGGGRKPQADSRLNTEP